MTKYSEEFKLQVVQEYLNGPLGFQLLAKKYALSSTTPLNNWVKAYRKLGLDGLKRKQTKAAYSVQFKVDVLHFIKQTGTSYSDTAITFGMNNPSLIANWNQAFQGKGVEGLKPHPKGRPSMTKKPKKQQQKPGTSADCSRQELEREIELLKLENAYLKKLKAFQKNPDVFLEKHKQQWHTNLKKKDSN
ncbi:transposase [Carnobacterium alterfunditum]|uniref:Transposase n=1 Tax=Carnobacterium alterfunditum TaxID=28230 RepID=A0A1N6HLA8_9LACT|nr:helix-turn-helix domain-containing protein [Carnobacterium alterfunditum]SIO20537.1 transposase [Carnobacterium alterfunditum]